MVTKYLCKRYGQYQALNYLKTRACPKRTVDVTIVQYMRMTHGTKYAAKDHKRRKAKAFNDYDSERYATKADTNARRKQRKAHKATTTTQEPSISRSLTGRQADR